MHVPWAFPLEVCGNFWQALAPCGSSEHCHMKASTWKGPKTRRAWRMCLFREWFLTWRERDKEYKASPSLTSRKYLTHGSKIPLRWRSALLHYRWTLKPPSNQIPGGHLQTRPTEKTKYQLWKIWQMLRKNSEFVSLQRTTSHINFSFCSCFKKNHNSHP